MNMAVSPEEIMERYTRGVVGLDDAVDYFYKRLYPRRYRWLQSAPQRAKRFRDPSLRNRRGRLDDVRRRLAFPRCRLDSASAFFPALPKGQRRIGWHGASEPAANPQPV